MNTSAPLLPVERKFWETYESAVMAYPKTVNQGIMDSNMSKLLEEYPKMPLDLRCTIVMICERAKWAISPSSEYLDALRCLNGLRQKSTDGESALIADIRSRYLEAMDMLDLAKAA